MLFAVAPARAQRVNVPQPGEASVDDKARGGDMQEILVTARRRQESIQSVPVTISSVKPALLEQRGGNVTDLVQIVTGLSQNAFSDRNNISFSIRGQQLTYGTLYPAVITYFAEVPVARISDGQSFDLNDVQVLKGPQGTLFGRVTDGGAILFNPRKPTNTFGGYVDLKLGNYAQREIQGAVNVPIVDDKILVRGAFDVNRRDGFTHNILTGKDLDDVSYEAGRLGVTLKISDTFENYSLVNYNHAATNGTATTLLGYNPIALTTSGNAAFIPAFEAALQEQAALGPRHVDIGTLNSLGGPDHSHDGGIYYNRKVLWVVNTTSWTPSDSFSIKNIFGYIWNKEHEGDDFDGSNINYLQSLNTYYPDATYNGYYEQFSDELQAQGKLLSDKLSYTIGLYGDYQRVPGKNENFGLLYDSAQLSVVRYPVTKSRAIYGQVTYDLGDLLRGLKFDAGVRYTQSRLKERGSTYYAFDLDPSDIPHGQCLTDASAYPSLSTPPSEGGIGRAV